jgi:hypothetical protein
MDETQKMLTSCPDYHIWLPKELIQRFLSVEIPYNFPSALMTTLRGMITVDDQKELGNELVSQGQRKYEDKIS